MWHVYILLCEDESLYTGITNNLEKRFLDHQKGIGGRYTRSHKPIRIVYKEQQVNQSCAFSRESEIKKLTRKQKLKLCEERNNSSSSGKGH